MHGQIGKLIETLDDFILSFELNHDLLLLSTIYSDNNKNASILIKNGYYNYPSQILSICT